MSGRNATFMGYTSKLGGMRTLIAFLVAPLTTLLPVATSPSDWGFFVFITLFYSYPLALFVGLPSYFYFRRMGWLRFWRIVGAGAVIGGLLPTLFALSVLLTALVSTDSNGADSPNPILGLLGMLGLGVTLGAVVALVFWLIAMAPTSRAARANATQDTAAPGE
jgi:hypothetical protein